MTPEGGVDARWRLDGRGWLVARAPLDLPLDDYAYFYFEAAVPPRIVPRASRIYYRLLGQDDFIESQAVSIPLLADGALHAYTYDLKLLELPAGACLSGLRLDPLEQPPPLSDLSVRITSFGLLSRAQQVAVSVRRQLRTQALTRSARARGSHRRCAAPRSPRRRAARRVCPSRACRGPRGA